MTISMTEPIFCVGTVDFQTGLSLGSFFLHYFDHHIQTIFELSLDGSKYLGLTENEIKLNDLFLL